MAWHLPQATIWARGANAAALTICATLARANGVGDRVQTGGIMTHSDFNLCYGLCDRFATSHTINRIDRGLERAALPRSMDDWSDMDRLMALWEWRAGPTPWLWMQARN